MKCGTGGLFRATGADRQEYSLLSTLLNIFLEKIMFDALEDHDGNVSKPAEHYQSMIC